jgi:hypothetical protein
MFALISGVTPDYRATQTPEVHISAGQSWRTAIGEGVGQMGVNPLTQEVYMLGVKNVFFPSGIEPPLSYIQTLTNKLRSLTADMPWGYGAYPPPANNGDVGSSLDIGRAASFTHSMFRFNAGHPLTPIINFNVGWPSSSWTHGPVGGLGDEGLVCNGTVSGSTFTVNTVTSGTAQIGQYVLNNGAPITMTGVSNFNSIQSGPVPTVNGSVYTLSAASDPVGPTALTTMCQMWYAQENYIPSVAAALPDPVLHLDEAVYRSVGWTQGGSLDGVGPGGTVDDWTKMTTAYDGLNLPGTDTSPLIYYVGVRPTTSLQPVGTDFMIGSLQFVRANANGRTVCTGSWYQWIYQGDGIHLTQYGTTRNGEVEGLARYITMDEGTPATPLWLSLTAPITRSGNTYIVPFDRPVGSFFAAATMSLQGTMDDPSDPVLPWPQYGFHVYRGSTELPLVRGPIISGMNVILDVGVPALSGDTITYAWNGVNDPTNTHAASGGGLIMAGPPSFFFPDKTIDLWALPFTASAT